MFKAIRSAIVSALKPDDGEDATSLLPPAEVNVMSRMRGFIRYSEIRHILDQLILSQRTSQLSTIAVISEFPGEGKTLLASALALGYAEMSRSKTLVVDTTTFTAPNSLSLDRALEPDDIPNPKSPVRHTLAVNVDVLRLRDWSSEAEGSEEYHVDRLIDAYKGSFGLMLFDTCALSSRNRNNINPLSVVRRCHGAILVISRATTTRGSLAAIEDRLRREKISIFGIVYNDGVRR